MIKNADIVRAWPRRKAIAQRLKRLRAQLVKLDAEIERVEDLHRELLSTTHVIDGVAIRFSKRKSYYGGWDVDVRTVGDGRDRLARIYTNAQNKKTFGLELISRPPSQRLFYGADWPSLKECEAIAIAWVARGQKPDRKAVSTL